MDISIPPTIYITYNIIIIHPLSQPPHQHVRPLLDQLPQHVTPIPQVTTPYVSSTQITRPTQCTLLIRTTTALPGVVPPFLLASTLLAIATAVVWKAVARLARHSTAHIRIRTGSLHLEPTNKHSPVPFQHKHHFPPA